MSNICAGSEQQRQVRLASVLRPPPNRRCCRVVDGLSIPSAGVPGVWCCGAPRAHRCHKHTSGQGGHLGPIKPGDHIAERTRSIRPRAHGGCACVHRWHPNGAHVLDRVPSHPMSACSRSHRRSPYTVVPCQKGAVALEGLLRIVELLDDTDLRDDVAVQLEATRALDHFGPYGAWL